MNSKLPATPQSDSTAHTDALWTADDVARYVGCSARQIRNFRYAGMPTIKFRHLIRFEPEVVKCWLREQNRGGEEGRYATTFPTKFASATAASAGGAARR